MSGPQDIKLGQFSEEVLDAKELKKIKNGKVIGLDEIWKTREFDDILLGL